MLQQLWRSGIRWDQEVPHEYNAIIKKWIRQCGQENKMKSPKFIGHIDIHSDILLLDFTDASQCAIAACIYIRISKQAHKQSSFTIGRTKSAPLNQESIRSSNCKLQWFVNFLPMIIRLLMSFAWNPADVYANRHKRDDQNELRFLWPTNQDVRHYQYTRLVFGVKCLPAVAILALH